MAISTRHVAARLLLLVSTGLYSGIVHAADQPAAPVQPVSASSADIVVTATRRSSSVQSVPINIAAVGANQIKDERLYNLREISRVVPGVYLIDQGPRSGSPIVFRGLNATGSRDGDSNINGGGTVATYLGEIPLYIDLRLKDVERVEFLLGPQGTLYGAGTLAGAIRYIPTPPKLDKFTIDLRGGAYGYSAGSGISTDSGATINVPLASTLAFRASLDYLHDNGFIDYDYVVRQVGVSNPDSFDSSNTEKRKDLNFDHTLTSRTAVRWEPSSKFNAVASFNYQDEKTDGRQISNSITSDLPVKIGKYETAQRVPDPSDRTNWLAALEMTADLGFAELTSASGYSRFTQHSRNDQSDLLIALQYGYELFPSFTAVNHDDFKQRIITQELRLVSRNEGRFSWIAGAFYNDRKADLRSREYTPGYDAFLVANEGGTALRPDELEYASNQFVRQKEGALYGELSYKPTSRVQVTIGGRYYRYDLKTETALATPLFDTVFNGANPDTIALDYSPGGQKDNGFLFKFNTSYKISDTKLVYGTISQGYRIGNSNGVAPCPDPLPGHQIVCALPNEVAYKPDKTLNFEVGAKTQWLDRRLTIDGAVYYIKWQHPQLASATINGSQGIIINGGGADTKGMELSIAARITDRLSLRGSYAYTDPVLTKASKNIIQTIVPPGFTSIYLPGEAGDRLPGSPHHQGSLFADYTIRLPDRAGLTFSYGVTLQSNVATQIGNRGNGPVLPGYSVHNASVKLARDGWSLSLFADNLWNKYAFTAVSRNSLYNQSVSDIAGSAVYFRGYYGYVIPPRSVGIRFEIKLAP